MIVFERSMSESKNPISTLSGHERSTCLQNRILTNSLPFCTPRSTTKLGKKTTARRGTSSDGTIQRHHETRVPLGAGGPARPSGVSVHEPRGERPGGRG